jgi:hypothetical protein
VSWRAVLCEKLIVAELLKFPWLHWTRNSLPCSQRDNTEPVISLMSCVSFLPPNFCGINLNTRLPISGLDGKLISSDNQWRHIAFINVVIFHSGFWEVPLPFLHIKNNKNAWEELIAYLPWYSTDRIKNDASVQQFFYCCMFIRCRGKIFTEPLPSNRRCIQIQRHRPMGVICGVTSAKVKKMCFCTSILPIRLYGAVLN